MPQEERNTVICIIMNVLVNGYILFRLDRLSEQGALTGPEALKIWASTILWVIPVAIAITAVLLIATPIVVAVRTGDAAPCLLIDERDKAFQIVAMRVTTVVMSLGFMLALVLLAYGWTAVQGLTVIYFGFAGGSLAGDAVKLICYRRDG